LQFSVADSYDDLIDVPLNAGQLIGPIEISTGLNVVQHKLGRVFRGWIVVRKNADIRLWEPVTQTTPGSTIALQSSGDGIVTFFVF
jgi:hypothetical protein